METVVGLTAIAGALLVGLGGLGTAIGWQVPGRRCAPAGNGSDAASENVHRRWSARRRDHDRCWYRTVLHLREPLRWSTRRLMLGNPSNEISSDWFDGQRTSEVLA